MADTRAVACNLPRGLVLQATVAGVLLASVAGCGLSGDDGRPAPAALPPSSSPASGTPERTAPRTFVAVGDSITAGTAAVTQPLDGARGEGSASWLPAAEQESGWDLVDGWAVPGATTADMLAGVTGRDWSADVLVVMAGTNDLAQSLPWAESAANLQGIAAAVGAPTVVAVAIAPSDPRPDARNGFNAALADLAAQRGWTYLDPWPDVDAGGAFTPGAAEDGVHPTPDVAAATGRRIGRALAALG